MILFRQIVRFSWGCGLYPARRRCGVRVFCATSSSTGGGLYGSPRDSFLSSPWIDRGSSPSSFVVLAPSVAPEVFRIMSAVIYLVASGGASHYSTNGRLGEIGTHFRCSSIASLVRILRGGSLWVREFSSAAIILDPVAGSFKFV